MANAERERFEKAYGKKVRFKAAQDLPPKRTIVLTIANAYYEAFQDFDDRTKMVEKLVLEFEEDVPSMIAPAPVATFCVETWGWDVSKFSGKRLPLHRVSLDVRGQTVLAARVDLDALDDEDGTVNGLSDNDLDPTFKKKGL